MQPKPNNLPSDIIRPPQPFGLPNYGATDLSPHGQGSLFPFPSSFHRSRQPRFDPSGPPDRNIPLNPNPDHLPPPDFHGDYFD